MREPRVLPEWHEFGFDSTSCFATWWSWSAIRRFATPLALLLGLGSISLRAQTFTEYGAGGESNLTRAIVAGPDGALWFTEFTKIGRITTSGAITEFYAYSALDIAVGSDGALWFTGGTYDNRIRRKSRDGVVTSF
jgi:hypothetical protein